MKKLWKLIKKLFTKRLKQPAYKSEYDEFQAKVISMNSRSDKADYIGEFLNKKLDAYVKDSYDLLTYESLGNVASDVGLFIRLLTSKGKEAIASLLKFNSYANLYSYIDSLIEKDEYDIIVLKLYYLDKSDCLKDYLDDYIYNYGMLHLTADYTYSNYYNELRPY